MNRWQSDSFPDPRIGEVIRSDLKESDLVYSFHPLYDWRAKPNLRLRTIETNEFGLRSRTINFEENRIRCLILGGSFAWGYGASSNRYIPSYLMEDILRGRYRIDASVINLAEQLYSSIQEIKSFVYSVNELKPSVVFCISAHNDIGQGFKEIYKNHIRYQKFTPFIDWGIRTGLIHDEPFWKKMLRFFYRGNRKYRKSEEKDLSFSIPDGEGIPYELFRSKMDVLNGICTLKKIKLVYILPPILFYKKYLSQYEKDYLEFTGPERTRYFKSKYEYFQKVIWTEEDPGSDNILFVDTTHYFDDCHDSIFIDTLHITDKGYRIWAEKLCETLIRLNLFNPEN